MWIWTNQSPRHIAKKKSKEESNAHSISPFVKTWRWGYTCTHRYYTYLIGYAWNISGEVSLHRSMLLRLLLQSGWGGVRNRSNTFCSLYNTSVPFRWTKCNFYQYQSQINQWEHLKTTPAIITRASISDQPRFLPLPYPSCLGQAVTAEENQEWRVWKHGVIFFPHASNPG